MGATKYKLYSISPHSERNVIIADVLRPRSELAANENITPKFRASLANKAPTATEQYSSHPHHEGPPPSPRSALQTIGKM